VLLTALLVGNTRPYTLQNLCVTEFSGSCYRQHQTNQTITKRQLHHVLISKRVISLRKMTKRCVCRKNVRFVTFADIGCRMRYFRSCICTLRPDCDPFRVYGVVPTYNIVQFLPSYHIQCSYIQDTWGFQMCEIWCVGVLVWCRSDRCMSSKHLRY